MANRANDPLQGFDIHVKTIDAFGGLGGGAVAGTGTKARLVGRFNSFIWKVINQTEAYLTLNQRVPRFLDGEVICVWSLDQGMVELDVVTNTFGAKVKAKLAKGRQNVIPRQSRFNVKVEAGDGTIVTPDAGFGLAGFDAPGGKMPVLNIQLLVARVDTLTFGVAPGKAVAGNSWQGTAEGVNDGSVAGTSDLGTA